LFMARNKDGGFASALPWWPGGAWHSDFDGEQTRLHSSTGILWSLRWNNLVYNVVSTQNYAHNNST
jgi:hypothetical protein